MDSYEKFMDKLGTLPINSPRTESRIEIDILQRLMTPEEAEIACNLSFFPEPLSVIAERAACNGDDLKKDLEAMVKKGVIFKYYTEDPLYSLYPMIPGVWEFQLEKLGPDDVRRWEQYWEEKLARDLFTNKTPVSRIVPVVKSIPVETTVFSYEEVEKIIDNARAVTLSNCICRTSKKMIGQGCRAPEKDSCLVLNEWADYYAENGMGRRVSKEKAREVLVKIREAGLIHNTMNVQKDPVFLCNCCGCCCASLRAITELKIPTALVKSNFIAEISADDCVGCGSCVERCHLKALELVDNVAHLIEERCIGCGVCDASCDYDAISLKRKEEIAQIPADVMEFAVQHMAGRVKK